MTFSPAIKSLPSPSMPRLLPAGPIKPRLRGVFHQYAFFVSLACGACLIATAHDGLTRVSAVVYAGAVSGLLGASALYHRVTWRPNLHRWMRRLDHSMIFVLIAGTYTPVALVALSGALPRIVLVAVWAGALVGVIIKLAWIDAPKWIFAVVYLALGWSTAAVFGQLPAAIGWLGAARIRARRPALHRRRDHLRHREARPGARRLRLPRGLPRSRGRGRRVALRGHRVFRPAARLGPRAYSRREGHMRASAQRGQSGVRA